MLGRNRGNAVVDDVGLLGEQGPSSFCQVVKAEDEVAVSPAPGEHDDAGEVRQPVAARP